MWPANFHLSWLGRRPVASSRKEVPNELADQSLISRQPVPISRRPTAKPSCDSSATSAIVLNFGRGEVAEQLQCMSDWGLMYCLESRFKAELYDLISITLVKNMYWNPSPSFSVLFSACQIFRYVGHPPPPGRKFLHARLYGNLSIAGLLRFIFLKRFIWGFLKMCKKELVARPFIRAYTGLVLCFVHARSIYSTAYCITWHI